MTLQAVERTWFLTGGYGWLRGECVFQGLKTGSCVLALDYKIYPWHVVSGRNASKWDQKSPVLEIDQPQKRYPALKLICTGEPII